MKKIIKGILGSRTTTNLNIPVQMDFSGSTESTLKNGVFKELEVTLNKIVKRAIPDAVKGVPPTVAENEIGNESKVTKAKIKNDISGELKNIGVKKTAIELKLKQSKPVDAYHKQLEPQKQNSLSRAKKNYIDISLLKEELFQLMELLANVHASHQEILNKHNRILPLKIPIIDNAYLVWAIIGFLAFVEGYVNLDSFQNIGLGKTNLEALFIAILFAGVQAGFAHLAGQYWYKKPKGKKTHWFWTTATFVICLIISGIRLSMDGSFFLNIVYAVINFMIAGITGLLAFFHSPHKEIFLSQRELSKCRKRVKNKEIQIEKMEEDYQSKCKEIESQTNNRAEAMAEADKDNLQKEIEQYNEARAKLENDEQKYLQELDAIEQRAINQYRHLYKNAIMGNGHKTNGQVDGIKNILPVMIVFFLGFVSCSTPPAEATYIEVLYDQTDTTHIQDVERMRDFIMGFVSYDSINNHWGETNITISQIGETSTQNSKPVHLRASQSNWFNRNELEHKKWLAIFKKELKQALISVTIPGNGMDNSYIHRNFYYRFGELAKQKGKRIILSWSDLILNSPEVNLYKYQKHPELIWEQRDSLIQLMTEHYPLSDSTGIKLVNIHQPTKYMDELHEACKRYFRYYWEKQGIEVEFITNIPGHQDNALNQTEGHRTNFNGIVMIHTLKE